MKNRRLVWLLVALVVVGGGAAAAVLLDPDGRVRGWVGGEPFYQGRAASAWGKDLRQADEGKAVAARTALVAGKGEAVPVCGWLLARAAEPEVRARAADVLKQAGPDAAPAGPAVVAALADADPQVRAVAAQAAEELAPNLPDGARAALVAAFPNPQAVRAVAKYGPDGADAVPKLLDLLRHDDQVVRFQAARALGKIGDATGPVVAELVRLMGTDPADKVREIGAEALGMFGPKAAAVSPDVVPGLAKALKDPAYNVRRDAVRSLGQLGPAARAALADVKAATKDGNADVAKAAGAAFAAINVEVMR